MIPDDGMMLCNLDIEQGDSRNIGAACWQMFYKSHGPEFAGRYLDACDSGDLHTTVCRMAWSELDWPEDPAKHRAFADQPAYRDLSYRDLAKRLGHGTNYLGQPETMAKHTKLPVPLVRSFQQRYLKEFACIAALHEEVLRQLSDGGKVTSIWGRERVFFGRADDPATQREAVAYVGQSPTADEINHAILNLWRWGEVQLLMQVHDSVLFQFPYNARNEIIPQALETAKAPLRLVGGREFTVPYEAKVGWNWGDENDDNPYGLRKWKGREERTPPKRRKEQLR